MTLKCVANHAHFHPMESFCVHIGNIKCDDQENDVQDNAVMGPNEQHLCFMLLQRHVLHVSNNQCNVSLQLLVLNSGMASLEAMQKIPMHPHHHQRNLHLCKSMTPMPTGMNGNLARKQIAICTSSPTRSTRSPGMQMTVVRIDQQNPL